MNLITRHKLAKKRDDLAWTLAQWDVLEEQHFQQYAEQRMVEERAIDPNVDIPDHALRAAFAPIWKTKHQNTKQLYDDIVAMLDNGKTATPISPDTVLIVAGNLLGIVLMLKFEQVDVIASKAINFILKPKS